jgi:hypothetical protein
MTKKELIDALNDFQDDMKVTIYCGFDARDPSGQHEVIGAKISYEKTIEILISED